MGVLVVDDDPPVAATIELLPQMKFDVSVGIAPDCDRARENSHPGTTRSPPYDKQPRPKRPRAAPGPSRPWRSPPVNLLFAVAEDGCDGHPPGDDRPGMPRRHLGPVFAPFLVESGDTGIGLSVPGRPAEGYDGWMWA